MSVPLINELASIKLERLDIAATRAVDPPGTPSVGYSPEQRAPIPYNHAVSGVAMDTRQYMTAVRIPCQVEVQSWEMLAKEFAGDAPDSNIAFVTHHEDLTILGLLSSTGAYSIKKGDKITAIEKNGVVGAIVRPLDAPLYIFEVRPMGWGFGDMTHDLAIIYTTKRPHTGRGS